MADQPLQPDRPLKRRDTPFISHEVPTINVGIISPQDKDSTSHVEEITSFICRVAPDRFAVVILGDGGDPTTWPTVHVLVLCTSRPNFPSQLAADYVKKLSEPPIVLSDFNLDLITSDRRVFYDVLEAHRVRDLSDKLPMRGYANRGGNDESESSVVVIMRREHIDVNGSIILKPCMERPVDATDDDFRIYYPMSSGGGCKHLKTGRFHPDVKEVREDGSFVYEELVDFDESANKLNRRYRKRDRLMNVAYSVIPGLGKGGAIPSFPDDDEVTFDSDLTRPDRKIFVVTTASLPWMTGTAVNPLLRAAYLARGRPKGAVTLVIPWLGVEEDRKKLYAKYDFATPSDQEAYVREWLRDKAGMPNEADPDTLKILWYEARYHPTFMSIFSVCDIVQLIPDEDSDVCVLEEPEHLNWFRAEGDPWTKKFDHTVGVVHTNYKAYAGAQVGGFVAAPVIGEMSSLMVRAYCDKVIKLSPVLQTFSPEKETVCNVHGVRSEFIVEGERRAKMALECNDNDEEVVSNDTNEKTCVYFVGKILWAKGLDKLLYLEDFYAKTTGYFFDIDVYGDGPELDEIKRAYLGRSKAREQEESHAAGNSAFEFEIPKTMREFRRTPIPARFLGRRDHAELGVGDHYKIFVNPSITEVLCTTTAEALAMGKFAIIAAHPSNRFFMQFPNCLPFANKLEFAANLQWALTHEPEPLSAEHTYQFTWEAATERFITASAITMREERIRAKAQKTKMDRRIASFHNALAKGKRGDVVRTLAGAGPVAKQSGKSFRKTTRRILSSTLEAMSVAWSDYSLWVLLALISLYALWWANLLPGPAGSEL